MIDFSKLVRSLAIGFSGIGQVLRSEQNMRIHVVAAVLAIGLGLWIDLAAWEWIAILFSIGLVLAAECFNTAIEHLADRITTDHDDLIGRAKDAAAAAVLILSITAAAVGAIVFFPKFFNG